MVIKKLGKLTSKEAIETAERYIEIRNCRHNSTSLTYSCWSHDNMFEISKNLNERLNLLTEKELKLLEKELTAMMRTETDTQKKHAISFVNGLITQILKPQESVFGL